jgi:polar amino acid transport system substrate-binding protein
MLSRRTVRLALCAAVALSIGALTACGSAGGTASENPYHLITPGTITAALLTDQPPFGTVGADGKPQGFAIDLAGEAAKRLGLKIDYKSTDIQGMLAGLPAERYDMGVGGVSASEERRKNVDFIRPYYWGFTGVLTKASSSAHALTDFSGKRVAVLDGSVQEKFVTDKVPGAVQVKFKDATAAVAQLLNGGVDVFVVGGADAEVYTGRYSQLKIAVAADNTQGTSFPIKKGNTALVNAFDQKIDEMINDGTFMTLYTKWFKRPISPRLVEFRPGLKSVVPSPTP